MLAMPPVNQTIIVTANIHRQSVDGLLEDASESEDDVMKIVELQQQNSDEFDPVDAQMKELFGSSDAVEPMIG